MQGMTQPVLGEQSAAPPDRGEVLKPLLHLNQLGRIRLATDPPLKPKKPVKRPTHRCRVGGAQ